MNLHSASKKNSKAVKLMRSGKQEDAVRCLGKVLMCLINASDKALKYNPDRKRAGAPGFGLIVYPIGLPAIDAAAADFAFSPVSGPFMVYDKAFVFMAKDVETSASLSDRKISGYSAVALYNMGLALHREGMQKCCSKSLQRALNMYEAAFKHVEKYEWLLGQRKFKPADSDLSLVSLAIINNVGHLHSTFYNMEQVQLWQGKLENCLTRVSFCADMSLNEEESSCSVVDEEDYAFFSLGILCTLSTGQRAGCASAA